jgi:lysophospholipase L1-like esterase
VRQVKRIRAVDHIGVVVILLAALVACSASSGPGPASASRTSAPHPPVRLVAIGDSIPFNSADDCPGCTGFVVRYASALEKASGTHVDINNLSQHNGLTLPMLLDELDGFQERLADADVILIGIAHNSLELNSDTPCGGSLDANDIPDWSKLNRACAVSSAATYRPQYEKLFSTVAGWRQGKPTILRTINRYNDWVGAPSISLTKAQAATTRTFIDIWNSMLCSAAAKAGFVCADIYHRFNGPRGDRPSGDLLGGDYTHPSDKGNEVIAATLVALGFAPLS